MAVDQWPQNNPNCLEDICVEFCASHVETFTSLVDNDLKKKQYKLQPGLSLPKVICDKLLEAYINNSDNEDIDDNFLSIFSDTRVSQLTNLNLRFTNITDGGLQILQNQPVLNLDLSHCTKLTSACKESIIAMGKTLRHLQLNTTPQDASIFECVHSCPHLRRLSLCNFALDVSDMNWKSTCHMHLTHLDLTECSLSYEFLEGLSCFTNLLSLSLADVDLPDLDEILLNICKLKYLRHLDLSQSGEVLNGYTYVVQQNNTPPLKILMDCLPCLTSLDISGTNLAGFEPPKVTSHRLGPRSEFTEDSEICSIPGLEGRHLEFLGLFDCLYDACSREHIPACKVTGKHNEEQLIFAMQVYRDRTNFLVRALNNMFERFQTSSVLRCCDVLDGILSGMERHPRERDVQISGSASLFYIAKGSKKGNITQNQKRRIIKLLLNGMKHFSAEPTMMRNGCLTLSHFSIPFDFMFCYKTMVKVLLKMLMIDHRDNFIHRIGIYLLNSLACQVDGKEKELVGEMGAIEIMLLIVKRKVVRNECDEILEVAWSTMWNVTDETPANCERFLNQNGMEYFLKCLKDFEDKPELLRNMMGLMSVLETEGCYLHLVCPIHGYLVPGLCIYVQKPYIFYTYSLLENPAGNIAEVKYLRPRLMVTEYVTVFSELLNSTSDGIEVSYNAAGVLSHMASDGVEAWHIDKPARKDVLVSMVRAIRRWDINSNRNINYRSFEPILRLLSVFHTPQVQHWAVWALCNLCGFSAERYCNLLKKENGIELLQRLLKDPRPYAEIKHLAKQLLMQVKGNSTSDIDVCMDVDFDEVESAEVDLGVGVVCDNIDYEDGGGDRLRCVPDDRQLHDRTDRNSVEQGLCDGRGDNMDNKIVYVDDSSDSDCEDNL